MVQQTSMMAFLDVMPSVGKRQREVYAMLARLGASSNTELSVALGWSINRVTPRIMELRKAGWVVDGGVRACRVTHRDVHTWRAR